MQFVFSITGHLFGLHSCYLTTNQLLKVYCFLWFWWLALDKKTAGSPNDIQKNEKLAVPHDVPKTFPTGSVAPNSAVNTDRKENTDVVNSAGKFNSLKFYSICMSDCCTKLPVTGFKRRYFYVSCSFYCLPVLILWFAPRSVHRKENTVDFFWLKESWSTSRNF